MSTDTERMDRTAIARHLSDAQAQTDAGKYHEALATVKKAKSVEPRNVYILAFEKQVEQLIEFAEMNILTDEHKSDILESIPGIIERALEPPTTEGKISELSGQQATLEREREEKAAALEWLKNQYFQHAHEYVRKGEYQHALVEIRRVYIIEPANRIAKDFEQQIEQLLSLHKVKVGTKLPFRPPVPAGETSRPPRQVTAPPANAEPSPSEAETPEREMKQITGRRWISPALTIGFIVALIAVAIILYSFFSGH
jgi:tetratricopeptide (TPR) repeat protein